MDGKTVPEKVNAVNEAIFRVEHPHARRMFEALKPEERDERGKPRTATRVWLEGDTTLVLSVRASDIPALRAALNMWLRLINVAYEMQELVSHG